MEKNLAKRVEELRKAHPEAEVEVWLSEHVNTMMHSTMLAHVAQALEKRVLLVLDGIRANLW